MTPFDPDPRHVDEDALWDPAIGEWVARPSGLIALLVGLSLGAIIGFLLGFSVVHAAAPRPTAEPAIPAAVDGNGASGTMARPSIGAPLASAPEPSRTAPGDYGSSGAPLPSPAAVRMATPLPATSDIGTAIESGIVAYAGPSLGGRYLALPGGPGQLVWICSTRSRCLERTSTDAGPNLAMQRLGRIADVSFVDFAWLCRCEPSVRGTMVMTIEWLR